MQYYPNMVYMDREMLPTTSHTKTDRYILLLNLACIVLALALATYCICVMKVWQLHQMSNFLESTPRIVQHDRDMLASWQT